MIKATLAKEISVETMNAEGVAAKLTHLVTNQAGANIRSAWAIGYHGKGYFSLITDNNKKVLDVLRKEYPDIKENDVIILNVTNHSSRIAEVTDQMSQAGINIDYVYTSFYEEKPALILSTNDNKKALAVINHQ